MRQEEKEAMGMKLATHLYLYISSPHPVPSPERAHPSSPPQYRLQTGVAAFC